MNDLQVNSTCIRLLANVCYKGSSEEISIFLERSNRVINAENKGMCIWLRKERIVEACIGDKLFIARREKSSL